MSLFSDLPAQVASVIQSALFTEFATLTAKTVPLNTPTYCFTGSGGQSIDVATGVAYPTKAERARRNPKVGLLLETSPNEPVVSVAAMAAVRDADIQSNANRYIAETIAYENVRSADIPWAARRHAIWYWSRIFILCTPKRILWWPNAAALDAAPQRWDAPAHTIYPVSDLAPAAPPSAPAAWPTREWRTRAQELIGGGVGCHLTLIDDEGFPLPFPTRSARLIGEALELELAAGAPWKVRGKGSVCFAGMATFTGDVEPIGQGARFRVERIMPDLPMVQDPQEIWSPSSSTRTALMRRLEQEMARRGLAMPMIAETPPAPTPGSLPRAGQMERMMREMALRSKPT